ncbi:hypothetical protein DMUE_3206, partial [Dictyocoela muelleri]
KSNIIEKYYEIIQKIGGNEKIVEIDESKFGKRKYERGHKVDGVWILGAVERSNERRIILKKCKKRSKEEITTFLKRFIFSDSILYTDGWRGYSEVKRYFLDHKIVNHSKEFVDSFTGTHINSIEGC